VSSATANFGLEFFRHTVVAHLVSGALWVASHAWGSLGELHAFVRHTSNSLEAVHGGRAGFGSGKVALSAHASAHRLAHGVAGAVTVDHHKFGPFSRAAHLKVHAALGLSGNVGAVGISHARGHVLGIHHHDVAHDVLLHGIGHLHVGSSQTDEEGDNEKLHGCLREDERTGQKK